MAKTKAKKKPDKPKPPPVDIDKLTPDEQDALDQYGSLIAQGESTHWDIGDLTNRLTKGWKSATFPDIKDFYTRVVKPTYGERAPAYPSVVLYARVAATWKKVFAINVGMTKMGLIWTWIMLTDRDLTHPLDDDAMLSYVDPKTNEEVSKPVLECSNAEIQEAIEQIKAKSRAEPPDDGNRYIVNAVDQGLEAYVQGGSALLVVKTRRSGARWLGLRPVEAPEFPAMVESLYLTLLDARILQPRAATGGKK